MWPAESNCRSHTQATPTLVATCFNHADLYLSTFPQGMLEEADKDGDGLVSAHEFTQIMLRTNIFK